MWLRSLDRMGWEGEFVMGRVTRGGRAKNWNGIAGGRTKWRTRNRRVLGIWDWRLGTCSGVG